MLLADGLSTSEDDSILKMMKKMGLLGVKDTHNTQLVETLYWYKISAVKTLIENISSTCSHKVLSFPQIWYILKTIEDIVNHDWNNFLFFFQILDVLFSYGTNLLISECSIFHDKCFWENSLFSDEFWAACWDSIKLIEMHLGKYHRGQDFRDG